MDGGHYYYSSGYNTTEFHSDYNAFYSRDSLGFRELNNSHTFSNWNSTYGFDTNSIFSRPQYHSFTDLHINNAALLNNAGTFITGVTDDIDGETRSLVQPDIGADEYDIDSLNFRDLELVDVLAPDSTSCQLADSIVVLVANHSIFPIDTLTIEWSLFGIEQDSSIYLVHIPAGDTVVIPIQAFQFISNTFYQMSFLVSYPNNQEDNLFNNNALSREYFHLSDLEIYERKQLDCTTDTELYIKTYPKSSILWSTGSTQRNIIINTLGNYTVTVISDNGCSATQTITIN
jgi:hypothetical protein